MNILKTIEQRNQAIWENVKPGGMKAYLIKNGAIIGLSFFIGLGIVAPLIDHGFSIHYFQSEGFRNRLIFLAVFTPLQGVLISYISWKALEKKY